MDIKKKISAQQKHIRKNYVRFGMDLRPEILENFKRKCYENGTTPRTEIKRFINEYLKN